MLPGSFEQSADVRELVTYAVVNGVRREVVSVSLDRDLAGDLPEQVVSGSGISGASGSITWAGLEDVQSREVSPWHKPSGWPPSSGDRVQVYVSDGITSWPRLTGVIDETTGTVGGGMQSKIIDFRDRLNGTFTQPALLRHMTPYAEGGDNRSVGLDYWHTVVSALRSVGVQNTPYMVAEIAVSVPMQGSMWPEAGQVLSAYGAVMGNHASFYTAPWGYSAGGLTTTYLPRTTYAPSEPLQITAMIAPDHAGIATFDAVYGSYRVRLRVDEGRGVVAFRGDSQVARLSTAAMANASMVTLLVKGGTWTLRNNAGQEATGGAGPLASTPMSSVSVVADINSRIAGFQVSRPNSAVHEFASLRWSPSMRFMRNGLAPTMDMSPRVEDRKVADLVDEICKATLTAAWWDESGVLQLIPSDKLRGGDPVQAVTTLDDVTKLDWEDSLLSVRSKVEVTWKAPSISKGRTLRKELFRAPGDSMEAQDVIEVFATPDGDTEWFGVDRNPRRLTDSNWGVYNRKRGSFVGAYFMNAADEELPTGSRPLSITTEAIGTVAVKITHTAGGLGTGVEANLGTSENAIALRPQLRGQDLPVIRGFGEGKWVDETTVSTITGPSFAPTLSHDLKFWGHRFADDGGSVAQRVGDYIAQQVTKPAPTITGLGVTYDPRRQLGDVIVIQAGILDMIMTALVVGISESHGQGGHEQSLSVRIIAATSSRKVTYDELAAAWAGGNYNSLDAAWAALNYDALAANPLEGTA